MNPLIQVAELAELIRRDGVDHGRRLVLLDVRFDLGRDDGRAVYEQGHIPASHWVDLEHDLAGSATPARAGRHPLPEAGEFSRAMQAAGVDHDSAVVITDGGNALAASRLWWMLTDAGHENVRVLDGGFRAWSSAGLDVEQGPGLSPERGDFVARPGQRSSVDGTQVEKRGTGRRLLDVRAPERYRGEAEPMDSVAGHIPGAMNRPSVDNFTADGRFRPPVELAERFADVSAGDIVYCGSGITAAQTVLAAEIGGVRGLTLYSGSWSDWITDTEREIAVGDESAAPAEEA